MVLEIGTEPFEHSISRAGRQGRRRSCWFRLAEVNHLKPPMLPWPDAYAFVALRLCFRGLTPMLSWLYAYALVALRLRFRGFAPML